MRSKIVLLVLCCLFMQNTLAGSFKTGNPERERTNKETFTEMVFKKFEKIQEMFTAENYAEARVALDDLQKRKPNPYELAMINQYIGWIESSEGNYVEAAKRFQQALDSDALDNRAHFSMMLQIVQMYSAGEQYQKALDVLKKYYAGVEEVEDKTYALEANIYYALEQYAKAIPPMIKAIELSDKPNERWMYLLYGAYKQESKFKQAIAVLEQLVELNPAKKEYWQYLSGDYLNLKEDKKALAVQVLAEKSGLVDTEKEKIRLFQMYAFLEIPYKAGKVLESGLKQGTIEPTFKRWEDLGKIWYMATEMDKALEAYTQASKLATDGKIDLYRTYIYMDKEQWKNAVSSIAAALEKGGLTENEIGKAWMLMGSAETEMKSYNKAIAAFKKAIHYPKSRNGAMQWIEHLEATKKQLAQRAAIEEANRIEMEANSFNEE